MTSNSVPFIMLHVNKIVKLEEKNDRNYRGHG